MSYALDTNGQNQRFVEAARRFGTHDGILSILAIGNQDPAGVVGRFQEAAAEFGGLRIRAAHRSTAYFDFPHDLLWTRETEPEILDLARKADVIHLNNSWMALKRFHLRKPALLHHHGTMFRQNPDKAFAIAKTFRMVQAVSTIDLLRPDPEQLHWLPAPYDIDALQSFGEANRREPDGRIRIVHSPTNRTLKHTDPFLQAIRELLDEGLPIDLVLVEGRPWAECMAEKAKADIVYDQLAFGYGCNSIEAWGMGIPVIAGADEWTLGRMAKDWEAIPFEEANERTLKDVIRNMVLSAELREDAAQRGIAHVRRYHDERPALERLAELYVMAVKAYERPARIPGKGVLFRSTKAQALDFDGRLVSFTDGELTSDDPFVIERLRYFSRKRPAFGISEVA